MRGGRVLWWASFVLLLAVGCVEGEGDSDKGASEGDGDSGAAQQEAPGSEVVHSALSDTCTPAPGNLEEYEDQSNFVDDDMLDQRQGYMHPADGILPLHKPYPEGLVMHSPTGLTNYGGQIMRWNQPITTVEDPALRGRVVRLDESTKGNVGEMVPIRDMNGRDFTVALWYRHEVDRPKVEGWNPLISSNSFSLFLNNGVPTVSFEGQEALVAHRAGKTKKQSGDDASMSSKVPHSLDDGRWHHVAMVVEDLCDEQEGPKPGSAVSRCATASRQLALVRLYVDRQLAGEKFVEVPEDEYAFRLNHMDVYGSATSQANYEPLHGLSTYGLLDDIFVYYRALSSREITQIARSAELGLVAVWPAEAISPWSTGENLNGVAPRGAAHVEWSDDFHSPFYAVSNGDRGQGPAENFPVDIVRTPGVDSSVQTEAVLDELKGQHQGSVVAWMRNGWLELNYDATGTERLRILLTIDNKVKIWCGNRLLAEAPLHEKLLAASPFAFDTWRLVTVTNIAGRLQVTVDGTPVGLRRPCTPVAFAEQGLGNCGGGLIDDNFKVTLGGEMVEVAWAAIFDRPVDVPSLVSMARPGPGAWLVFRPDQTSVYDQTGQAVPVQDEQKNTWIRTPGALESGARGFHPDQFTVSLRFTLKREAVDANARVPLLQRLVLPPSTDHMPWAQARLESEHLDFAVEATCRRQDDHCDTLVITVPNPQTKKVEAFSFYDDDRNPLLSYDEEHHLVLAWPGVDNFENEVPRVSLDGRKLWTEENIHHGSGQGFPPVAPGETWWRVMAEGTVQGIKRSVSEVRIYPYALGSPEEVDGSCAELTCATQGRACVESTKGPGWTGYAVAGAVCTGCLPDHYLLIRGGDSLVAECAPKGGLGSICTSQEMCADGTSCLTSGVCGSNVEADVDAYCRARGRQHHEQTTVSGETSWGCWDCLPHHEPIGSTLYLPWSHPDRRCSWVPTQEFGELCLGQTEEERNFSCNSGLCHCEDFHAYGFPNVQTENRCVCATRDRAQCEHLGREAIESSTTPYDGVEFGDDGVMTPNDVPVENPEVKKVVAYECQGTSMQCRQDFEKAWTIMSPSTCQTIKNNSEHRLNSRSWPDPKESLDFYHDFNVYAPPQKDADEGMRVMKRLFTNLYPRRDTLAQADYVALAEPGPEEFGNLSDHGVGSLIYSYVTGSGADKLTMRTEYGDFLPFKKCAETAATGDVYFSGHNHETCVPKLLHNGAQCPPHGEEDSSAGEHSWCRSSYCHGIDKVCATGGNHHRQTKGQSGDNQKDGDISFGVLRHDSSDFHIKEDESKIHVNPTQAELDTWKFIMSHTMNYDIYMFGIKQWPTLLSLKLTVDKSQGVDCSQGSADIKILGFKVNGDPPKPLTGCSGPTITSDISSGSFDNNFCEANFHCEANDPFEDILSFRPEANLGACIPIPGMDKLQKKKSLVEYTGLPLSAEIGATLDLCVNFNAAFSNGLPQFVMRPSAGIGGYAKAGLGLADDASPIEFWAGVQLSLTIYEIGLPITFGLDLDGKLKPSDDGQSVKALFELQIKEKIELENIVLSGWMGVFAELGFLFFSIEKHWSIFEWEGFKWVLTLVDKVLYEKTIDFDYSFDPATAP